MEPGDITDLVKTGGNGAAGFTIGHLTGNDIVVILTVIYLVGQCIVLSPKVWNTVKKWLRKDKGNG